MKLWYRHSGEPEVEEFPPFRPTYRLAGNVEEITSTIGDHHITHMSIKGKITLSLSAICQRLAHLKLSEISSSSQLLE